MNPRETVQWTSRLALWPTDPPESNQSSTISSSFQDPQRNGPVNIKTRSLTDRSSRIKPKLNYQLIISGSTEKRSSEHQDSLSDRQILPNQTKAQLSAHHFRIHRETVQWTSRLALWPPDPPESNQSSTISSSFQDPQRNGPVNIKTRSLTDRSSRIKPKLNYQLIISGSTEKRSSEHQDSLSDRQILPNQTKAQLSAHHFRIHRETVQWTSRLALWPTDPPESNQSSTISSSFQDPQRNGPVNIKTRSLTDRSSRIKPKLNYQLIISGSTEKRSSEHQDSLSDRQILPNQTKAELLAHHFRIHRETVQWTSRLALWPTDPPESNQSSTISSSFQDPQRNGPVTIKTRSLTDRSSRIKPKLNYQLIISGSAEKRSSEHQDSLSDRQILPNQTKAQLSAHHFRIHRETVQWTSRLALWPTDPPESNQSWTISSSFQDPQRNGPVNIKTRSLTDRSSRIKPKLNYQLIISGSAEKRSSEHQDSLSDRQILPNQTKAQLSAHHFRIRRETVQWPSRLALWPTDPPESNQSSTISSSFQDPQRNGPVNIKTRSLTDRSSRIKPKLNYQLIISGSTEKRSSEHQDSLSDRQILPNQTKAQLSAHHFRIHRETVQWTSRLALWPPDPPESNQSWTISSSFQDPQRNGPVNIKTRSLTDRSSRIKPKLNYQLIISGSTEKRSSEHQDSLSDRQILPNQTKAQLSAHHFRIHRETVQWTSRLALWPPDPPESNQSWTISSSFQDPQRNGPVNIKTRSLTDRSSRIKPKLNYQLIISGSTEKRSSEHQDSLSDRQILPNQTKAQLSAHHFRIHRETVQWTSRLALWPTDPPESNQSSTISSSFQDPRETVQWTSRLALWPTDPPESNQSWTISSSFQDPQRNGPVNIKTRSLTDRSSRIKPKLNYQLIISGSQRNGPVNIKTRSLTDRSSRIKPKLNYQLIISGSTEKRSSDHQDSLSDRQILPNQTKAQLSAHHFRIHRETVQWTSRLALWPTDPPESNQSSTISSSFQDPQRNGPVNIKTRSLTDRSSRIKPKLNYQLIISGSAEKRSSEHQDSLSDRQILPNQTKAQLSAHHFRIHRETVQWTSRLALWPTDPPESNQSSTISSSFQDPQRNGPVNIKTRSLTARSSRIKPKLNYQLIISGSTEKRSSEHQDSLSDRQILPNQTKAQLSAHHFRIHRETVQWTSRLALWPTDPPESNQSWTISSSFQDPQRNGPVNIKTRSLTDRSSRIKPKLNYQLIISGSTEKRSREHQDSLSDRQILPNQTKAQLSAHHFRIPEKRSSEHQDSLSDRQILPNQTKAQLSAHHFRIHRETVQWTSRLALWPTDPPESNQSSTISSSFQDPQRNGPVNIKTRSLTDRSSRIKPKLNYQLIISGSAEKRSSEHQDSLSDRQILPNQTKAQLPAHHFRIHRETVQWTSRLALWPTDPPESNQSSTISSSFQDPQRNGPVNIKTRSLTDRSSRIKPKLNYQLIISGSTEKRSSDHQDSLSDRQILPNQTKAQLSAHHFRIHRETVQWTSRLALWPTDPPESNQSSTISSSFQDPQRNGPVNIKTRSLTDRSSRIKPKLNYQLIISGSTEKRSSEHQDSLSDRQILPNQTKAQLSAHHFRIHRETVQWTSRTRSLTDRSSRIKPKLNYQLIISGSTEKRSSEHQDSLSDRQILPNQTKAQLSAHHFRIHRETVQWTSRLALWPPDPPESNQSSTISSSFQDPQRNGPVNIKTRSLTDRSSRIKPKLNYQLIISGSAEKRSSEHQDSLSDRQILPNQTKAQLSAHHFRIHRETVQWTSRLALWPTDPPESNQSSTISSSFQDPQRNGPVNIKTRSLTDRSSRIKPKLNYQLIISGSTEKRSSEHQDSLSDRQILPNQTKAQLSAHHFRIRRETVQWPSRLALWPTDPPESNQSSTISSSFQDPQRNGPVNIKTRSLTDRSSRIKPKLNYQLIISGSTEKRSSDHQDSLSDRQILPNQTKAQLSAHHFRIHRETVQWTSRLALWPTDPPESNQSWTISSSFQDPQRNGPVNIKTRSLTDRSSRIKPKLNYQLIISGSTEKRSSEHQDSLSDRQILPNQTKAQLSAHHFRIHRTTSLTTETTNKRQHLHQYLRIIS